MFRKVNAKTKFLVKQSHLMYRDCLKLLASSLVQGHFDYACISGIIRGLGNKL